MAATKCHTHLNPVHHPRRVTRGRGASSIPQSSSPQPHCIYPCQRLQLLYSALRSSLPASTARIQNRRDSPAKMNIFRFLGDLSHLASIFILLHKIQQSRSCRGISFKTQLLYLIVFLTRYIDLLTGPYVSVYNTLMKLFFIGSTGYTLYLMRVRYR